MPAGTRPSGSPGITLKSNFLPGYSPGFNPIERLWLRLKADYFSDFIGTPDQLTPRLCTALNAFMHDTNKVASQCATRK